MDVFFQMRFAYCGKPEGVLPNRTRKPIRILDDEQILKQFDLLERVTLPSLRDQNDPSFRLQILTSARMPEDCQAHLSWLLNHYLPGRANALYARPMIPGRVFRRHMQGLGKGNDPVVQTMIHNGEAFSELFVQRLREHAIENWAGTKERRAKRGGDGLFMSFRRGWLLGMKHKSFIGLEQCSKPIKPFALSLIARPSGRYNPMLINPDHLGSKFPHVSIMTQDIHCLRVVRGSRAEEIAPVERRMLAQAQTQFPVLRPNHRIRVAEDQPVSAPLDVDGVVPLRRAG